MSLTQASVLLLAVLLGGVINSVAGGGSFIAFPALLMYNPRFPIESIATNTVALWPGISSRMHARFAFVGRALMRRVSQILYGAGVVSY